MSAGALVGSPLSGLALDRYGVWVPISVTAGSCAIGCLWRGIATSLVELRLGAVLLGVGINLWSVVLGHLVKSFPEEMRSEVISGFGVQMTVLQLCGKGVFPLVEVGLHRGLGVEDALVRYRIHMGMCTFFCFYGMFALFWDRENVRGIGNGNGNVSNISSDRGNTGEIRRRIAKYQEKHSDIVDELEIRNGSSSSTTTTANVQPMLLDIQPQEMELATISNHDDSSTHSSYMLDRESGDSSATGTSLFNSSSTSFLNEPEPTRIEHESKKSQTSISAKINTNSTTTHQKKKKQKQKLFITTITLTFALLVQSISTTILAILWPLLAHDRFDLSAHTFGMLTFLSSAVSTGAVASFPVVERMEMVGGRVRCAAWGFGVGAMLCFVFCMCSFGSNNYYYNYYYWGGAGAGGGGGEVMDLTGATPMEDGDGRARALLENDNDAIMMQQEGRLRHQVALHAVSAITFQAALCFLEPSLKSILSLVMSSSPSSASHTSSSSSSGSSLGLGMGLMNTLGSVGGMIGNLAGMWMYKFSKDIGVGGSGASKIMGSRSIFQGGSLPFVVTAVLMAVSSTLIWRLEEPTHHDHEDTDEESKVIISGGDVESGIPVGNVGDGIEGSLEDSREERNDSCCLALRETTYDLKLD